MRRVTLPILLAVTLAAPALAQEDKGLRLNEQGIERFKAGEPSEALALFRQALELIPENETVRANAARCLVELGDRALKEGRHEDAARDYHEAGGLVPGNTQASLREALALYRALRDRDALAILEPIVKDAPDDVRARDLIARVLYRLGENARAIEHWEHAAALDPEDVKLAERLERAKREESVEKELYVDLSAAHFSIKYDGTKNLTVGRTVTRALEVAYQSVGALLGRYPKAEVSVVVYPERTFQAATGAHGWIAGLYDGKIRVPAGGLAQAPPAEVRRVLTHEYAHALVRAVGGPRVPSWLHEGFAQIASGRSQADARGRLTRAGTPSLEQLSGSFAKNASAAAVRILYAAACDFVHTILNQGGSPALAELLEALARRDPMDEALRRIYGQTLAELHAGWRASLP